MATAKGGPAFSDSDGHVAKRGAPLRARARARIHTTQYLQLPRCSMFTYVSSHTYLHAPDLRSHLWGFDLGGVLDVLVGLTDQCSVHRVCRPRLKSLSV